MFAAFDRTLLAEEGLGGSGGRRWLWPMAAATLAVAGVLVLARGRLPIRVIPAAKAVIHGDGGAVWSKHREEQTEKVTLERGTLWIHVDHGADHTVDERRFLVVLPDGELEDQGTTFTVSAEDGHTKRVTVEEGRVVLRIRGQQTVAIASGGTWRSETRDTASARPSVAPAVESRPQQQLFVPQSPARPASRPHAPVSHAPVSVERALPDQVVDFRAAMAAFQAGDNVGAAAAFASFVVRYPQDPRSEDAAYLRVIALQRCGADRDMKRAAGDYLRRYPDGFRHAEVDRLFRNP